MIPTAEEFIKQFQGGKPLLIVYDCMIEFTKLHVQAALEATAKMGEETWDWTTEERNSILEDSYPLTNIK